MRKFIAKKGALSFSIETNGDGIRFFGLVSGKSYNTRKDVTPETMPNKQIINEIIARGTLSDPMSKELESFVAELEQNYHGI